MPTKILITGGAGFVGSSLALLLKEKYPVNQIIVIDNLKRKGSELNLKRLNDFNITFIHGDIRNREDFSALPEDVDTIIEASAEPSVLAGLAGNPEYLINTNLAGTINCLYFANKIKAKFIFLSTSRIYPIEKINEINFNEADTRFVVSPHQHLLGITTNGIAENFPIDGYRSFYGATKLASELLIQEFNHFYGLKTVINRCGVITGPWQMGKVDQGVVVLWVAKHFWKQKLEYIGFGGKGKQIRDVLHVKDLFRLIDFQIHNIDTVNGEVLNVGGGEMNASLLELTAICKKITGNEIPIAHINEERTADIRMYITDNSKVNHLTGWSPNITVEESIYEIHQWLLENEKQLMPILK